MIKVRNEGIILEKSDQSFENMGVYNPTVFELDNVTHMFYRAINDQKVSSIGYCKLKDNKVVWRSSEPIFKIEETYEAMGFEDPRLTFLNGIFYLFYTVYDGENALVAYATSKDLTSFEKKGLITLPITYEEVGDLLNEHVSLKYKFFEEQYQSANGEDILLWEKDAFLFTEKINGKFALIHRVLPSIQIMYLNDLSDITFEFWRDYLKNIDKNIVMEPKFWYESGKIGGGAVPVKGKNGWILIYHGVENSQKGRTYHASAALLAFDNPQKVLGRLSEPLFSPTANWEKNGLVNNVVFPTGTVVKNNRMFIYYGAADTLIAAKSVDINELEDELLRCGN